MARKNSRQDTVDAAAQQASEAARTLQARGQEKKVEATTTDAPKQERQVDPGAMSRALRNRPSSQAMDEILSKRGLGRDDEEAPEPKSEVKPVDPTPVETEVKAEVKTEPEVKAEAPAETQTEIVAESPKMTKQKVDGEEYEVSEEEITEAGGARAWRIAKAQENRLAKMNETLAEMKKAQAEAATKKEPEKPSVSDQQFIAERMEKIRFGTPEEAAQAQLEIHQRLYKPTDENATIERAAQKIKHDAAVAKFDQEFSDLAGNPILLRAVVAIRNERIQQLPKTGPVDWEKFYRTIGNEVRSAVGRQSQPAPQAETKTASTPSSADKEAKKAAAVVALPTTSSRAALPQEEKELTPEQERDSWFKDTKKARRQ